MARPIKEIPIMTGKDAERFRWHMDHPSPNASIQLRCKNYDRKLGVAELFKLYQELTK